MAEDAEVDLSVILACYHEEQILGSSVPSILKVLRSSRLHWEILFVDDASRDRTPELIRRVLAEHPDLPLRAQFHERNQGRGRTVADGFRAARGAVVGFLDVDLEVAAHYILPCWQAITDGADVAVGKRVFKLSMRSIWRYALSTGYARLVRWLLPIQGVSDTESGFKFFRRPVALELIDHVDDPGWFWDTEIMYRAVERRFRVVEIPCLYVRKFNKRSTVRAFRDSARYLRQVFRLRRQIHREARLHGVSEAYWQEQAADFAAHYDRNRSGLFTRFVRRFLERRAHVLDNWLHVVPGTRVLDAGCGHGVHFVNLGRQGAVLTGRDISADMLELARNTLASAGVKEAELICAPLMGASLPSAFYGMALAIGLLDYLPDWRRALLRLSGYVTIGGTVIFSIPKRPSPFFFLRTRPGIWLRRVLFDLPPVLVTASRAELTAAAAEAGLILRDIVAVRETMWLVRAERIR